MARHMEYPYPQNNQRKINPTKQFEDNNIHVITEELPDETVKITTPKITQFGKGFTIPDDAHCKENTMIKQ
jgi:hypothetical protein